MAGTPNSRTFAELTPLLSHATARPRPAGTSFESQTQQGGRRIESQTNRDLSTLRPDSLPSRPGPHRLPQVSIRRISHAGNIPSVTTRDRHSRHRAVRDAETARSPNWKQPGLRRLPRFQPRPRHLVGDQQRRERADRGYPPMSWSGRSRRTGRRCSERIGRARWRAGETPPPGARHRSAAGQVPLARSSSFSARQSRLADSTLTDEDERCGHWPHQWSRLRSCVFTGRPGWRLSADELDDRARPPGAGGRTWRRIGLSHSAG